MNQKTAQLVVIGAGPGGYAAAFLAADLGMAVTIIDTEPNPGGVCLYRGCIPSKALLHVAKLLSEAKEAKAKTSFKTIYLREANMNNAHDNAAVTVMSYGLRPANRNLNSEKAAIKSFKAIFGFNPSSASNWDAVRAVAYSGATR